MQRVGQGSNLKLNGLQSSEGRKCHPIYAEKLLVSFPLSFPQAKGMRKKLSRIEEENETLQLQLNKMSTKAKVNRQRSLERSGSLERQSSVERGTLSRQSSIERTKPDIEDLDPTEMKVALRNSLNCILFQIYGLFYVFLYFFFIFLLLVQWNLFQSKILNSASAMIILILS